MEGKGKTVQYLCQEAINQGKKPLVIRYCGGPQASHTVIHDGITHVCSSFGSGVLLGVPTFFSKQALIDPIALKVEYEVLESKGIKPTFGFHYYCRIITPYDVIANRQNQESLANGTCGCGIWETINRSHNGTSFYAEYSDEEIRNSLALIADFYKMDRSIELEDEFVEAVHFILEKSIYFTNVLLNDYNVLIMESSQGLLLDGVRGLKPYTTPCEIGPIRRNSDTLTQYWWNTIDINYEIYLCTRTYTTRHGAGYIPTKSDYIKYPAFEANKDNQYQGQFKTGILDIDMINRAIDRHCLDNIENCKFNLVINHVDCVGSMFEYIYKGKIHIVPGFDAVTRIKNLINLKFDKVLIGKSPLSEFKVNNYE